MLLAMCWNVIPASESSKNMQLNWNSPLEVLKAVLWASFGFIGICQYPEARSSDVKYLDFPSWSSRSSMRGRGYRSCFVSLFRGRKSMQNRKLPSSLRTKWGSETHSLCEGLIMPFCNISSTAWLMHSYSKGERHCEAIRKGIASPVSIECCVGKFTCDVWEGVVKNAGKSASKHRISNSRVWLSTNATCVLICVQLECVKKSGRGGAEGRINWCESKCNCVPVFMNQPHPKVMGNNWRGNT